MSQSSIPYHSIVATAPSNEYDAIASFLLEELPHEWDRAYRTMCIHSPELLRITIGSFEYIFDPVELGVRAGTISADKACEDRVVAVHGRSSQPSEPRRDHLMRGRPLGAVDVIAEGSREKYDKGHFIAHTIGGGIEINIFPQVRALNRGQGKHRGFRQMERFCQKHPGTYLFIRPTYLGRSWHPATLEFGVLKPDGTLWLEVFQNFGEQAEIEEIERLVGPAITNFLRARGVR